ncbi:MAG: hypothetical protein K9G62_08350 [Alphaproteobacteria bacterium]|nr:hypothetical protein [Alphaproteobacteria bacterium]
MFGLNALAAGGLLILAGTGGELCDHSKPPPIHVEALSRDISYDYRKNLRDLQGQIPNAVNPHAFGGSSVTQGFMKGALKITQKISLAQRTDPVRGIACVWYDRIDVTLEIDPSIVIAREVAADPCMKKAVEDHEMNHIQVDREVADRFARSVGKELSRVLEKRGFASGVIEAARLPDESARMQRLAAEIVKRESDAMEAERLDKQRKLDSREEYKRVAAQCPDFTPKP